MGAEGGITITSVKTIKKDWTEIREKMIHMFNDVEHVPGWWLESRLKINKKVEALPEDIGDMSGSEIEKMLSSICTCSDTPYYYGGDIITSWGDNVDDEINIMSQCLGGWYLETWT